MNVMPEEEDQASDDPWDPLFRAHRRYLADLECLAEMFEMVAPILAEKDKDRTQRVNQIVEQLQNIQSSENDDREPQSLDIASQVSEFLDHISRISAADRMFRQGSLVSVVSKFDEFLTVVLRTAFEKNVGWLRNPQKTITHAELLDISSLDEFIADLIRKEVDQLMRGSHHGQVGFLDEKLKLGVQENFDRWVDYLEVTERRNLFVHGGGVVNSIYQTNAKRYGFAIPGEKTLTVTDEYFLCATDTFVELSTRIVQSATRRLFAECYEEADWLLNNQGFNLLKSERWDLAARLFDFAINIPSNLRSDDEVHYFHRFNFCIAAKHGGRDFSGVLKSIDWKPLHPKYHLAIAVLEDRFSDAAQLMREPAVLKEVDKHDLLSWPLFREFRNTADFKTSYKEVFGEDFEVELLEKARHELTEEESSIFGASEEDLSAKYPLDYQTLIRELADRYTDFKANQRFHATRKELLDDQRFAVTVDNGSGGTKVFYSRSIFGVFDHQYTLKRS